MTRTSIADRHTHLPTGDLMIYGTDIGIKAVRVTVTQMLRQDVSMKIRRPRVMFLLNVDIVKKAQKSGHTTRFTESTLPME